MGRVKIAPSFLTAHLDRLGEEVRAVERAGADYLHLDVMDGHFVPPISFGGIIVEAVRSLTRLTLDVHLMVSAPERHVESFVRAGGDILNVHVEACEDVSSVLRQVKSLERRAGVCVNPGTPISAIEGVLDIVDQVIVMGVNPGWGGQPLIEGTLPKVNALRDEITRRQLSVEIEIDGGVKTSNARACAQAGANVLVAGSVVFNDHGTVEENMGALRAALKES